MDWTFIQFEIAVYFLFGEAWTLLLQVLLGGNQVAILLITFTFWELTGFYLILWAYLNRKVTSVLNGYMNY